MQNEGGLAGLGRFSLVMCIRAQRGLAESTSLTLQNKSPHRQTDFVLFGLINFNRYGIRPFFI
jgi:hypothetical protein